MIRWSCPSGRRLIGFAVLFCLAATGLIGPVALGCSATSEPDSGPTGVWLSTLDGQHFLEPTDGPTWSPAPGAAPALAIMLDPARTYQQIEGLGSSLEPATCYNLSQLDPAARAQAITRLLDPEQGIGMNLMRICIGTPDFTADPWYSYDDRPSGHADPELEHFSIDADRRYILPVLLEARKANPNLRFFASPWSPPGWMKTTGSLIGGEVNDQQHGVLSIDDAGKDLGAGVEWARVSARGRAASSVAA